ncbi:MAG: hypothetical protein H6909_02500 [Rickettsiaceae bacterium]|nr:hypothetical protein [Rickettsiaceae bacterium]
MSIFEKVFDKLEDKLSLIVEDKPLLSKLLTVVKNALDDTEDINITNEATIETTVQQVIEALIADVKNGKMSTEDAIGKVQEMVHDIINANKCSADHTVDNIEVANATTTIEETSILDKIVDKIDDIPIIGNLVEMFTAD